MNDQGQALAEACVERMARLLADMAEETGADDPASMLRDALGDLRHYADAYGLDFAKEDGAAYEVYLEERKDSQRPFKVWPWEQGDYVCRVAREPFTGAYDVWGYYTAADVARGIPEHAVERANLEASQ